MRCVTLPFYFPQFPFKFESIWVSLIGQSAREGAAVCLALPPSFLPLSSEPLRNYVAENTSCHAPFDGGAEQNCSTKIMMIGAGSRIRASKHSSNPRTSLRSPHESVLPSDESTRATGIERTKWTQKTGIALEMEINPQAEHPAWMNGTLTYPRD